MQGAGGVGGLLSQTKITASGASGYFPLADANGNCVTYLDEAGNVQAHYTYDAFGGTVTPPSGDMADNFRLRFSSKYLDDETGLYYYGYRYISPTLGRWSSRDPIEEWGGLLLYGFIGNDGVSQLDLLGLTIMAEPDFLQELFDMDNYLLRRNQRVFDMYNCLLKEMGMFASGFTSDSSNYLDPNVQRNYASGVGLEIISQNIADWLVYVDPAIDYYNDNASSASDWVIKPNPAGGHGRNWRGFIPWANLVLNENILLDFKNPTPALMTLVHEPQHDAGQGWAGHDYNGVGKINGAFLAFESYAKNSPWDDEYCCPSDKKTLVQDYWTHMLCKCGFLNDEKTKTLKPSWEEFTRTIGRK